jgi:hypothetical protein
VACTECGYELRSHTSCDQCPECGAAVSESVRCALEFPPRFSSVARETAARMVFTSQCFGIVALGGARLLSLSRYDRVLALLIACLVGAAIASGAALCNASIKLETPNLWTRVPGAPRFVVALGVLCCIVVGAGVWTGGTAQASMFMAVAVGVAVVGIVGLAIQASDLTPTVVLQFGCIALVASVLLLL